VCALAKKTTVQSNDLSDEDQKFLDQLTADERLKETLTSGLEFARRECVGDQRAAWAISVDTLVNFMKKIGVEPRFIAPLEALSSALDDLQYGIVDPGLKPARFEGGPRIPTNMFLHYVNAAVAVTLLHEDGYKSLDEAILEASKLSGIPKRTLAQFRKNTLAGRRSWKANAFYWIKLRHIRTRYTGSNQRLAYIRQWFDDRGPLPQKVP
jgi:hypothetical protein